MSVVNLVTEAFELSAAMGPYYTLDVNLDAIWTRRAPYSNYRLCLAIGVEFDGEEVYNVIAKATGRGLAQAILKT